MKIKNYPPEKQLKIVISGSGGQGIMLLGKLIAGLATKKEKYTTWIPSYGAEIRGGSAYCFVKISNSPIASPIIDKPDIGIIFNRLAFKRFKGRLEESKLIILNSDLIKKTDLPSSIEKISLPLNTMAAGCGNVKVANIIVLGVLSALKLDFATYRNALDMLNFVFHKKEIRKSNIKAFREGRAAVKLLNH
ncbi:MAG: hypothetical protein GF375_04700 [Candidatus Omnitrophica bacterium]|nr:hypothetical protein [Candidatus Omnitrophota bacterium]MBD3269326.1 hypothetical protein [Candidatus Omnitrophota bacterium]